MKNPYQEYQTLFTAALDARQFSYAHYSQYKIGSALLTDKNKIYSGCNVENASYGATVCAERVAIWKAVSEGAKAIREIVIMTRSSPPAAPCGFCRQVMNEFTPDASSMLVHFGNPKGEFKTQTLDDLLPESFGPRNL